MSGPVHLTGEPLALDLVNTHPSVGDLLTGPDELRAWLLLEADRSPEAREFAAAELTDAALEAVRGVRAHTAHALDRVRRGERPPSGALDALTRAQGAAPAVRELHWNGTTVTATRRRTGPTVAQLTAWLAEAAADLLTDPSVATVRQCAAEDCVLLFLPAHPRRRWCSAARCGNRVRVARHYRRHRSA
ncbi:CGNR zinc finger domain-containing protein [Streptomyces sp. NPDC015220]|uniref:CGNR zinc finger domain-containing protein n=1 Tax=Streptomyces sp. NPDC015220 TaxID=3364947 RepID=UPI0036F59495